MASSTSKSTLLEREVEEGARHGVLNTPGSQGLFDWEVLHVSLGASLQLFLMCFAVVALMKLRLLPESTPKVLSQVCFHILIPCFHLTSVARTMALDFSAALISIPLAALLQIALGAALGSLVWRLLEPRSGRPTPEHQLSPRLVSTAPTEHSDSRLLRLQREANEVEDDAGTVNGEGMQVNINNEGVPHEDTAKAAQAFASEDGHCQGLGKEQEPQRPQQQYLGKEQTAQGGSVVVAACAFGNAGTLPLVLLSGLLGHGAADQVGGYLALFLFGYSSLLFTVGYSAITCQSNQHPIPGPHAPSRSSTWRRVCQTFSETILSSAKQILNPPMYGIFLGLLIGGTPLASLTLPPAPGLPRLPQSSAELAASALLRPAFASVQMLGTGFLSAQVIVLAASLAAAVPSIHLTCMGSTASFRHNLQSLLQRLSHVHDLLLLFFCSAPRDDDCQVSCAGKQEPQRHWMWGPLHGTTSRHVVPKPIHLVLSELETGNAEPPMAGVAAAEAAVAGTPGLECTFTQPLELCALLDHGKGVGVHGTATPTPDGVDDFQRHDGYRWTVASRVAHNSGGPAATLELVTLLENGSCDSSTDGSPDASLHILSKEWPSVTMAVNSVTPELLQEQAISRTRESQAREEGDTGWSSCCAGGDRLCPLSAGATQQEVRPSEARVPHDHNQEAEEEPREQHVKDRELSKAHQSTGHNWDGPSFCSRKTLDAGDAPPRRQGEAQASLPQGRAMAAICLVRFLLLPAVMAASALPLSRLGLLPANPLCILLILMESCMPPAQNLVLLAQLNDNTRPIAASLSSLLLKLYTLSIISTTAWMSIFLALVRL